MMKIALLSEKYTPDLGGLAISTGRLGESLAAAGHDVRLFAPSSSLPATIQQTLHPSRVHVTRFGAHKRVDDTLVDWFELIVEEHKRKPFDVIHAYFLPLAGFVGTYAGTYLHIPSVVSIRGNDIERAAFDPSKFSHVMYALQNADAVTTNASELAKKAKAFIDREIHVIPNGVDTERFKPMEKNEALAEALGLASAQAAVLGGGDAALSNIVIGFVGELREKKGLATLLSGYAQVNKRRPATLLIVGEVRAGVDEQALAEFRSANPDCQIIVTGQVPHKDLPAYYSLMDVFVHPSLRDGMPNAVLEAMACGMPVIATPVGGAVDVIENGKNGIFINVNDAHALSEKIMELLNIPERRAELGKNARESIVDRFTPAKELEANLEVYRTIGGKV
ncbi:MAG: glycosyltransferase [Anaerolineales bacterium]|nr:glycosyltransferase [Anaerolineales bacterium]